MLMCKGISIKTARTSVFATTFTGKAFKRTAIVLLCDHNTITMWSQCSMIAEGDRWTTAEPSETFENEKPTELLIKLSLGFDEI